MCVHSTRSSENGPGGAPTLLPSGGGTPTDLQVLYSSGLPGAMMYEYT